MSSFDEAPEPEPIKVTIEYQGEKQEYRCEEFRLDEHAMSNGQTYLEMRIIHGMRSLALEQLAKEQGIKLMSPVEAAAKMREK